MHGDIGINFVDYSLNQRAPVGHESAETPIGNHESCLQFKTKFGNKFGHKVLQEQNFKQN